MKGASGVTDTIAHKLKPAVAELEKICSGVESEYASLFHQIGECIKHRQVLLEAISLTASDKPIEAVLRDLLDLIPTVWRYPDETSGRIVLNGVEHKTTNFIIETDWKRSGIIHVGDRPEGIFEVFYMEDPTDEPQENLIWNNQEFIDGICEIIGRCFERRELVDTSGATRADLQHAAGVIKDYEKKAARFAARMKALKEKSDCRLEQFKLLLKEIVSRINTDLIEISQAFDLIPHDDEYVDVANKLQKLRLFAGNLDEVIEYDSGSIKLNESQFSLRDLISSAISPFIETSHEKHIEIIGHCDPLIPDTLIGDSGRMRYILKNLLDYLLSITTGGDLIIRCEIEVTPYLLPIFHFTLQADQAHSPDCEPAALFDCLGFSQDRPEDLCLENHIRLTIARQLVEMLGGEIWMQEKSGADNNCATFHFRLWLDPKKPRKENDSPPVPISYSGERVLIIDPKEVNCTYIAAILESINLTPVSCTGFDAVTAAVEQSEADNARIAVVIVSLDAVAADGTRLLDSLLNDQALPGERIIATCYGHPDDDLSDLSLAAILQRPLNQNELLSALEKIIDLPDIDSIDEDNTDNEATASKNNAADYREENSTTQKLLLVSTDRLNQVMFSGILRKHGFAVDIAGSSTDFDRAVNSIPRAIVVDASSITADDPDYLRHLIDKLRAGSITVPSLVMMEPGDTSDSLDIGAFTDQYVAVDGYTKLAETIDALPETIPEPSRGDQTAPQGSDLDYEKILEAAQGDIDLLTDMLDAFEDESTKHLDAIKKGYREKAWALVRENCRRLSRMSEQLGAGSVQGPTESLIVQLDDYRYDDVSGTIETISSALNRFLDDISHLEKIRMF